MRLYRVVWDCVAVLVGSAAVAGVLLNPSWPGLVTAVVICGLTGGSTRFAFIDDGPARPTVTRWGLASAGAAVLVVGLPTFIGPWSMLVALVLGLSAPTVWIQVRRWRRLRSPVQCADQLARWDCAELEERWRRSSAELLLRTTSVARKVELVEQRSLLLDALVHRDPLGFQGRLERAEAHR